MILPTPKERQGSNNSQNPQLFQISAHIQDKFTELKVIQIPQIFLSKGGGNFKGIHGKIDANAGNGAFPFSIAVLIPSRRNVILPFLSLSYNSESDNSSFGFGCLVE